MTLTVPIFTMEANAPEVSRLKTGYEKCGQKCYDSDFFSWHNLDDRLFLNSLGSD